MLWTVLRIRTTFVRIKLGGSAPTESATLVVDPDPEKNERGDKLNFIFNFRPTNYGLCVL